MAYLFPDPATSICLLQQTALSFGSNSVPFTINCWFKTSTLTTARQFIQIGTTTTNYHRLAINASNQVVAQSTTGTLRTSTAGAFSSNTWSMATGVWSAVNSRLAYTNGTAGTAQTNTVTVTAPTILSIGGSQGNSNCFDVNLAEVAIWDVALTAAEITSLYTGVNSTKIRPENLLYYLPLVRSPTNTVGTNVHFNYMGTTIGDLATNDTNATTTDHVRRYG